MDLKPAALGGKLKVGQGGEKGERPTALDCVRISGALVRRDKEASSDQIQTFSGMGYYKTAGTAGELFGGQAPHCCC